jgi:hypothetical protein
MLPVFPDDAVVSRVCDHLKHLLAGMAPPSARQLLEDNAPSIGSLRFLG